jgi:hypothetical protein
LFLILSLFWLIVLKGRGFSRAVSAEEFNSVFDFGWRLFLILGGAAVYRCDNELIFTSGFSR